MKAWLLALACLLMAWSPLARAQDPNRDNIRVILDTSCSMNQQDTDADRLAKLATLLLFDLAQPNLQSDGESFIVYPFDDAWPPPAQWTPRIQATAHGAIDPSRAPDPRGALQQALLALPYDASNTYYAPGIERAVGDLEKTPGGLTDRRVIVLITDGLPGDGKAEIMEGEKARIHGLAERMNEANIRLYIVAVGQRANDQIGWLRDLTTPPPPQPPVGEAFDTRNEGLLRVMISVFSHGFGYTAQDVGTRGPSTTADLAGAAEGSPLRSMVLAYVQSPAVPELQVRPPPAGKSSPLWPAGLAGGGVGSQHAYRLWGEGHPSPGQYAIGPGSPAQIVVLRPTRLALEVTDPSEPAAVMADVPFPLKVEVFPEGGLQGDTPELNLYWQAFVDGTAVDNENTTGRSRWDKDKRRRTYELRPNFPKDRWAEGFVGPYYEGTIQLSARLHEVEVGSLTDGYRVNVYPRLRLEPTPPEANATRQHLGGTALELQRGDRGCAEFELTLRKGRTDPEGKEHLPVLNQPDAYPLRISLADQNLPPGLADANITVEMGGRTLPLETSATPPATATWSTPQVLTASQLTGQKHRVCVKMGQAVQREDARLQLDFVLDEAPYSVFPGVITPFFLRVNVGEPPLLRRLAPLLCAGLSVALLLLWARLLVRRPTLPPDLGFELARVSTGRAEFVPRSFPRESLLTWILGLKPRHALRSDSGDKLGWLVPIDRELYEFRSDGASLFEAGSQARMEGVSLLRVQREYTLRKGDKTWLLRLAFR